MNQTKKELFSKVISDYKGGKISKDIAEKIIQKLKDEDPAVPSKSKLIFLNVVQDYQEGRVSRDIAEKILQKLKIDKEELPELSTKNSLEQKFPELVRLNNSTQSSPVFWIHGGLSSVDIYLAIALNSSRPFYGIQARGWMTERAPLEGIQAMAAYYVHIIQSVQPEGPYDLGGFSLGGILAYEVTRQLQELGETVSSIVMIDTFDTKEIKNVVFSPKSGMLQLVNMALLPVLIKETGMQIPEAFIPEKMKKVLIHQNEVDLKLDDEEFFKSLLVLGKKRGLIQTKKQIEERMLQLVKVQLAYKLEQFSLLPLSKPKEVDCYYFRNKNRSFAGGLEPYYILEGDLNSIDGTNYWSEWEQLLPKLHIMDLDAFSHMTLLAESRVSETLSQFARALYAKKEMDATFYKSFQKEIKKKHGILKETIQKKTKEKSKKAKEKPKKAKEKPKKAKEKPKKVKKNSPKVSLTES